MFFYQNKINKKDSLTLVCQTVDEGKQLPLENDAAMALYEKEPGELVLSSGEYVDGEFVEDGPSYTPYLTFSSPNSFTLSAARPGWDGTLEYSTDTNNWNTWDGSAVSSGQDNTLYLRGKNNTKVTGGYAGRWALTGSDVSCNGDIRVLLDYSDVESTTMADSCYSQIFRDWSALVSAPVLPAMVLAEHCYTGMFYNCTNLTIAPSLPATALASYCYQAMFEGCTNLIAPPELPATILADNCYLSMFARCTSITTTPSLPAETLEPYCYNGMFQNCSSLTNISTISATVFAGSCCQMMFAGCTALVHVPQLTLTNIAEGCCASMFSGCTSLETLLALPATSLKNYCYESMFKGCSKIKISETQTEEYVNAYRVPVAGEGTVEGASPTLSMFSSTGGTFTGAPAINTTYYTSNTIV